MNSFVIGYSDPKTRELKVVKSVTSFDLANKIAKELTPVDGKVVTVKKYTDDRSKQGQA